MRALRTVCPPPSPVTPGLIQRIIVESELTEIQEKQEEEQEEDIEEEEALNTLKLQPKEPPFCLLDELTRYQREIEERERQEWQRQEAQERLRREENLERWRSFQYITLSQRINKPWVFSFFKNIPMRIYCQPIQSPPKPPRRPHKWR